MKKNFDSFHGTILFKANYRVNRPRQPDGGSLHCRFGASAHAVRDVCMMGVKDYFHF
ncbi:MAG TPA: hypothetical protein VKO87_06000 [Gemmatimonadaceae bacterium]|jgi:hypothetical protein|nr:hypothetical protein [Gemmatimonadaceae bacterium]